MLSLRVLSGRYAVCRLDPGDELPAWAHAAPFASITRTDEELSVVCSEGVVPAGVRQEGGWALLQVRGPLAFDAVGILASLAAPLAEAGLSIFALSTFDTDYLLIRHADLAAAVRALAEAGHVVDDGAEGV